LNSRDYKDAQVIVLENHPADSRVKICEDGVFQTLSSRMGTGGGNVPMVVENGTTNEQYQECWETGVYKFYDCNKCPHSTECEQKYRTMYDPTQNMVVRRLTPLECTRLQGYPDGWVDIGEWTDSKGKKHKDADAPKYKALGNSIALPFWEWLAKRIVQYIGHEPTMASLFSGIGGFELVFARAGVKPVWASEVEDFAIAVTKKHFPDEEKITKEDIFEWVTE